MKRLNSEQLLEFQHLNEARADTKRKPLKITVVECLACTEEFESYGNRLCGCETEHDFEMDLSA